MRQCSNQLHCKHTANANRLLRTRHVTPVNGSVTIHSTCSEGRPCVNFILAGLGQSVPQVTCQYPCRSPPGPQRLYPPSAHAAGRDCGRLVTRPNQFSVSSRSNASAFGCRAFSRVPSEACSDRSWCVRRTTPIARFCREPQACRGPMNVSNLSRNSGAKA